MPIVITLMPRKPEIFTVSALEKLGFRIAQRLFDVRSLGGHMKNRVQNFVVARTESPLTVLISIRDMCVAEGDIKSMLFIRGETNSVLESIGLDELLLVHRIDSEYPKSGEKSFLFSAAAPKTTRNAELLEGFIEEEKIPADLKCSLSCVLMDTPVYIQGKPELKYDRAHLIFWLYQQEEMCCPYRKIPITIRDIVKDDVTQEEIKRFVSTTIEHTLKTAALLKRYKCTEERTPENFALALRRTAAHNCVEDLSFFITQTPDLNMQDTGRTQRTALHWAGMKGGLACAQALFQAGADPEILDGAKENPYTCASKSQEGNLETTAFLHDATSSSRVIRFFKENQVFPDAVSKLIIEYASLPRR